MQAVLCILGSNKELKTTAIQHGTYPSIVFCKLVNVIWRSLYRSTVYVFLHTEDVTYTCDFETNVEPDCFLAESTDDDYDFTRRSVRNTSILHHCYIYFLLIFCILIHTE